MFFQLIRIFIRLNRSFQRLSRKHGIIVLTYNERHHWAQ